MDLSHLNRALQPLVHRIKLAVSRGKVRLVYKGNKYKTQRLQVELLAGELSDGMEHFEPYGFTASPVLGAEALVQFLGGNRAHGIAGVVSDGRSRPRTLSEGEVAIYHCSDDPEASAEAARHRITLTSGKIILRVDALDIKCGPSTLQMDAAGIRLAGPRCRDWRAKGSTRRAVRSSRAGRAASMPTARASWCWATPSPGTASRRTRRR